MRDCDRQETRIAKLSSGKRTPGSGNKGIKGDVRAGNFLFEAKYRSSSNGKGSYIDVQREWLIILLKEAKDAGKVPVLVIDIGIKGTCYMKWSPLDKSYDLDVSTVKSFRFTELTKYEDIRLGFGEELGVWVCYSEERFFECHPFFPTEPVIDTYAEIKKARQKEQNLRKRAYEKEKRQRLKKNP